MKLIILQIGLGNFGKTALKKWCDLNKTQIGNSEIEFFGVCDTNELAREESLKIFNEKNVYPSIFSNHKSMFNHVTNTKKQHDVVLVYDASSSSEHAKHIIECIKLGFFCLIELPPYIDFVEEKQVMDCINEIYLSNKRTYFNEWLCCQVESENPVVLTLIKILKKETKKQKIKSIETHRFSSIGLEKTNAPLFREGLHGGDLIDLLPEESYLLKFFGENPAKLDIFIKNAKSDYLMISNLNKEPYLVNHLGQELTKTNMENNSPVSAQTTINLKINNVPIKLNSGWLGLPTETKKKIKTISKSLSHKFIYSNNPTTYFEKHKFEGIRLIHIQLEKSELIGDLNHNVLFSRTGTKWTKKKLVTVEGDPLSRIFSKTISYIIGNGKPSTYRTETEHFMHQILLAKKIIFLKKMYSNPKYETQKTLEKIKQKLNKE